MVRNRKREDLIYMAGVIDAKASIGYYGDKGDRVLYVAMSASSEWAQFLHKRLGGSLSRTKHASFFRLYGKAAKSLLDGVYPYMRNVQKKRFIKEATDKRGGSVGVNRQGSSFAQDKN
jgi:hypothetical protein